MDNINNSSFPKKIIVFSLYLFIMYILTTVLAVMISIIITIYKIQADLILLNTVLNLTIYGILFTTFLILLRKYFKEQLVQLQKNIVTFITTGVGGWFLLLAATVAVNLLLQALNVDMRESENQKAIEEGFKYIYLTAIFAVIFAPVVEEVVFRGVIFNSFRDLKLPYKLNVVIGMLVSSIIFGSIHVLPSAIMNNDPSELILGIPYAVTGLVLVLLYYFTNNIFVPIITHFTQNLFSILVGVIINYMGPTELTTTGEELVQFIRIIFKL